MVTVAPTDAERTSGVVDGQSSGRTDPVTGALLQGRHHDVPVEIVEAKLYRPAVRPGVVPRPGLLARLRAARDAPTVAVVAPAGYGKTTLLALWAEADDRPFAWLSLDPHDNDPIVLLTHLAVALDRISRCRPTSSTPCARPGSRCPPRSSRAWARPCPTLPRPLAVVVDDVHHLRDGPRWTRS